ncbi:sigma-70 family RNA polymerase sigma factor [Crocinitomix sp.]|nr:sigma-70 family RNA polymerase sigma factor [Crocinitomix sp.]
MDQDKLKKQFINGNKKAFDIIYRDYSGAMYTICLRYTKNTDKAADILQEAFIKVYKKRDLFNPIYDLGGWIKRIVINEAINQYRVEKRFEFIEDETYFETEDDEALYIDNNGIDIKKTLNEILEELPDGYRTVFSMYVFDNLKHQEIADYLEISINTSKTQLSKARKMICKKLEAKNITRNTVLNG